MTRHDSLPDVLGHRIGLFLSDLCSLEPDQKARMRRYLSRADPEKVPHQGWEEAVYYIAGVPPAMNCREAWERPLEWLKLNLENRRAR